MSNRYPFNTTFAPSGPGKDVVSAFAGGSPGHYSFENGGGHHHLAQAPPPVYQPQQQHRQQQHQQRSLNKGGGPSGSRGRSGTFGASHLYQQQQPHKQRQQGSSPMRGQRPPQYSSNQGLLQPSSTDALLGPALPPPHNNSSSSNNRGGTSILGNSVFLPSGAPPALLPTPGPSFGKRAAGFPSINGGAAPLLPPPQPSAPTPTTAAASPFHSSVSKSPFAEAELPAAASLFASGPAADAGTPFPPSSVAAAATATLPLPTPATAPVAFARAMSAFGPPPLPPVFNAVPLPNTAFSAPFSGIPPAFPSLSTSTTAEATGGRGVGGAAATTMTSVFGKAPPSQPTIRKQQQQPAAAAFKQGGSVAHAWGAVTSRSGGSSSAFSTAATQSTTEPTTTTMANKRQSSSNRSGSYGSGDGESGSGSTHSDEDSQAGSCNHSGVDGGSAEGDDVEGSSNRSSGSEAYSDEMDRPGDDDEENQDGDGSGACSHSGTEYEDDDGDGEGESEQSEGEDVPVDDEDAFSGFEDDTPEEQAEELPSPVHRSSTKSAPYTAAAAASVNAPPGGGDARAGGRKRTREEPSAFSSAFVGFTSTGSSTAVRRRETHSSSEMRIPQPRSQQQPRARIPHRVDTSRPSHVAQLFEAFLLKLSTERTREQSWQDMDKAFFGDVRQFHSRGGVNVDFSYTSDELTSVWLAVAHRECALTGKGMRGEVWVALFALGCQVNLLMFAVSSTEGNAEDSSASDSFTSPLPAGPLANFVAGCRAYPQDALTDACAFAKQMNDLAVMLYQHDEEMLVPYSILPTLLTRVRTVFDEAGVCGALRVSSNMRAATSKIFAVLFKRLRTSVVEVLPAMLPGESAKWMLLCKGSRDQPLVMAFAALVYEIRLSDAPSTGELASFVAAFHMNFPTALELRCPLYYSEARAVLQQPLSAATLAIAAERLSMALTTLPREANSANAAQRVIQVNRRTLVVTLAAVNLALGKVPADPVADKDLFVPELADAVVALRSGSLALFDVALRRNSVFFLATSTYNVMMAARARLGLLLLVKYYVAHGCDSRVHVADLVAFHGMTYTVDEAMAVWLLPLLIHNHINGVLDNGTLIMSSARPFDEFAKDELLRATRAEYGTAVAA